MDAMTSMYSSGGSNAAASGINLDQQYASGVSGKDLGINSSSGGGFFGTMAIDPLEEGSSQQVPFVGPIVSVFQAFNDERDARNTAQRLDFNARAEELIGKTQTVSALRFFNQAQARNVVAGFTSGGGLAGSRGRVTQDVSRDAQLGFDLIRTNAEIKSADLKQKANIIRKVARFDRNVAIGKSVFRFVEDIYGAAAGAG